MLRIQPRRKIMEPVARMIFALILIALLAACRSIQPTDPDINHAVFRNDPSLIQGTFDNGFRYVIKQNHEPKQRVSMHLVILAGSIHESDNQKGLAHFLEHMMFNGTRHFPPGELVKYFQSIGMQFGGDANAHTGFYETVYDVVLPMGGREQLQDGLRVLRDYADGALLLESEVQKEKNVILAEKRDRDSADYRTFEATLTFELPDMRLSRRLPIGDEDVIKTADRQILKAYYDTWYRPDRMILVVVGDVEPPMARELIEAAFSGIEPQKTERPEDPEPGTISHEGVETFYHYEKESGKTSVSLEVLTQVPFMADTLSLRTDMLVRNLVSRMVQNRLDVLTRKSDSPVTSASISAGTFLRHVRYGNISADCSPDNWEKALAFIEQNLRQALVHGFSDQELDRVRQDILSELEQDVKTASTRNSNVLSREIIRDLANRRIVLSPQDTLTLFAPFVGQITRDKANACFREIWGTDHRLVMVTGNADLKRSHLSPTGLIRKIYEDSGTVGVLKREEQALVTFPYLTEPAFAGEIRSRQDIPDLGLIVVTFENGVKLNLKRTDFDANHVQFRLIFGGGKAEEPPGKPGLASLAMNLINESGFNTLDKEELKRALAGKNTEMVFSVAEDSFVVSGTSVPDETPLLFQLLRTQILDPGFHEDAYHLTMERMKQNYEEMEKTVAGMDDMRGEAFFAGGDPRFGLPSYEIYRKNTIADVRDWVGRAFQKDSLELSLVGDFDPEVVIDNAAIYLGSLPGNRNEYTPLKSGITPLPAVPQGQSLSLSVKTVIPKGLVKVAYPTDDFWDISRTRRLSVLGAVFSEKLRNRIREELGAAYSPYAYNQSSLAFPGYGIFQAVVTVDPAQAGQVADRIGMISSDLSRQGISADELKRAVDPILTSIKDMRRTNSYWLNSVLSGSGRYPVKLDWARTMEVDYGSITVGDIHTVARRYLDSQKAACLYILPEPKR